MNNGTPSHKSPITYYGRNNPTPYSVTHSASPRSKNPLPTYSQDPDRQYIKSSEQKWENISKSALSQDRTCDPYIQPATNQEQRTSPRKHSYHNLNAFITQQPTPTVASSHNIITPADEGALEIACRAKEEARRAKEEVRRAEQGAQLLFSMGKVLSCPSNYPTRGKANESNNSNGEITCLLGNIACIAMRNSPDPKAPSADRSICKACTRMRPEIMDWLFDNVL